MAEGLTAKLTPQGAQLIGLRIVELINENVEAGVDKNEQSFAPYSTEPFARPIGGLSKSAIEQLRSENQITEFVREGKVWIVVLGGYVVLKRAMNPAWSGRVDMTQTGNMMQQLGVIRADEDGVEIGFRTPEAAETAYWHVVAGAGQGHTVRDFLGISERQQSTLGDVLDQPGIITIDGLLNL